MSHFEQLTSAGEPGPSAHAFFGAQPIFRFEDFEAVYATGRTKAAARAIVDEQVRHGRLINIRRGVFRYLGPELDPYALGSQLSRDAVIAYASAVEFHRMLKTEGPASNVVTVMSSARIRDAVYEGHRFRCVEARHPDVGVDEYRGLHQPVRVTTPTRTLVDIIDRPELGPGLPEVFQIMLNTPFNPWDLAVIAQTYGRTLTMMRLAYFMSFHPGYGEPRLLSIIENRWRPKKALYWDRETRLQKGARLYPRWNLMVPTRLDDSLSAFFDRWHH